MAPVAPVLTAPLLVSFEHWVLLKKLECDKNVSLFSCQTGYDARLHTMVFLEFFDGQVDGFKVYPWKMGL